MTPAAVLLACAVAALCLLEGTLSGLRRLARAARSALGARECRHGRKTAPAAAPRARDPFGPPPRPALVAPSMLPLRAPGDEPTITDLLPMVRAGAYVGQGRRWE
jgi:hypothetical protein